MSKKAKLYAEICKTEKQDDGTIKVWGYASSASVDSDGEIITPEAMKAALPDYMKFGAVREMHQPLAAGTAIEANVEDDGRTFFGAHVVDPIAVIKVETGVYKGFSIGGKVEERDPMNKSIITGLRLVEVSLVDRPANPDAVFTMFKMDGESSESVSAIDELAAMLDKGEVTPEKLLALAKGEAVVAGEPAGAASAESTGAANTGGADIRKGMYELSSFASLLNSLGYLCADTEWEAQNEGDVSAIPEALRNWLTQGVAIYRAMAVEETDELLARLRAMVPAPEVAPEIIAAGDKVGDIAKAGARFSKDTKAALTELHKVIKAADGHLDKLGYKDEDEAKDDDVEDGDKDKDVPKGDQPGGSDGDGDEGGADSDKDGDGKEKSEAAGDLEKRASEALSKVAQLEQDLAKAQARVAELEAKPAPGKALLKAVAIQKGADVADAAPQSEPEPIRKADGSIDGEATALALIKFQHQHGGVRIR